MNEYQRVLYAWAKSSVPRAAKILHVALEYEEGFCYSSWTCEDASFKVRVDYLDEQGQNLTTYVYDDGFTTMGTLLNELFKIADEELAIFGAADVPS